jgi:Fe2+ or Zn2+ uptake regulation protein
MITDAQNRILSYIQENDERGVSTKEIFEYLVKTGPTDSFNRKGLLHHLRQLEGRNLVETKDECEQFCDAFCHWHWHVKKKAV